ncbi:hypothetical protein ACFYPC_26625 [Streptomyces sp. NPDC005808]|uniref:hypothetical protein n=1 Tax=Streptomyces sp. NPDC005808 TaxID=3364734 RepID=UPI0036D06E19
MSVTARSFQPTMSADRARQAVGAAGIAARAAFADAVSAYAALMVSAPWNRMIRVGYV